MPSPTTPSISPEQIATILVKGQPMDFSIKEDGSYVIIAPNGMKFRFSSDQVKDVIDQFAASVKPKTTSRGRPKTSTTVSKPKKED